MALPNSPQQLTPGSSFYPQNHDLVTQYLLPKMAGSALPAATQHFFFEADVYAQDPETLTSLYPPAPARTFGESQNWYFFSPVKSKIARDGRKPRIVGGGKGSWKGERGEAVVEPVEGRTVGRLERFTYTPKPKEEGKKPEWLMVEFSLDQEVGGGEPRIVLCKIYRSPRFLRSASKASSSASACSSNVSGRKRKAADLAFSPAPLSASARKTMKTTPARRQLMFPYPPGLNPPTHEAFLGENSDPLQQQQQLRVPNPLAVLGDEQSWSEFSTPTPNPYPPGLNPPTHEAFLGENSDPLQQQQQLRVPNPLAVLGDEQSWSEFSAPTPNPSHPVPNSPVKDTFLGENPNSMTELLQFTSPPAPNLTADVEELLLRYLADDKNWDQHNGISELPAPWPCSMTVAPPVPFCSGRPFY